MADIDERFAAYVRDRGEHHLRVAALLTGDWHAAEDLVQASLVKLYRAWPRLRLDGDPDAYLRRIMVNTHRSWWRARWRREMPAGELPEIVIADFADGQALAGQVRQALQALPRQQRAALATVTSALTRTLTQSYHLSEHDSSYYIVNGRIQYPAYDACTTEADPVRHLEATSCSNGPAAREVGGYTYLYIPDPVAHPGKHWQRMPAASLFRLPSINGFITATPQQMLAEIKKADTVTVAGPAVGSGWTGTRYAFSASPGAGIKLSGTVTVDRHGRARALVLTTRLTSAANVLVMTQVLTFSDFGAPVTVTPPPADQTYSGP